MAYELPDLPYAYTALEPYIDAETMHLHHDKHHKAYVDKLNEAVKDYPKYQKYDPEVLVTHWKKLPRAIQEVVRNNAGGDVNHTMFWTIMKKNGGGKPSGEIAKQINKDFKTFDKFKKAFNEAGTKRFGSGWVWLIVQNGKLVITTTPNQDSPLTNGSYPIFGFDLWEHSFYLKYHNKKDEYFDALWNVLNWDEIEQRFTRAKAIDQRKPVKTETQKQYGA